MAKSRKVFLCRSCGSTQSRWMGKCPDCGAWDALEEATLDPAAEKDAQRGLASGWGVSASVQEAIASGRTLSEAGEDNITESELGTAVALSDLNISEDGSPRQIRLASGMNELDRVLGGGLVVGSAVLVGGEPGIGKSTLLLQSAFAWARSGSRVLYVSSEESARQVAMRGHRLFSSNVSNTEDKLQEPLSDRLFILSETNLARIVEQARRVKPSVIVVDSIQMVYKSDIPAAVGSITQLRRCCSDLVYLAKATGIAVVMVGHVTKEGTLAGPRLLEHLVDAVISFEGDRYHSHRVIRAAKNRYGTTFEIGIFEMTGRGLAEVANGAGLPAAMQISRPGSVVCPVLTGTRCILVELQALTATGFLGAAKRKSSGLDTNRLAMLIAVLEQHGGLRLADRDVFASSVGGVKVVEPASDLALLLAIAGAHYRRGLGSAAAAVGEVGLGGEIRGVPQLEQRIREAVRLGYKNILVPALHTSERDVVKSLSRGGSEELNITEVKTVDAAIAVLQ